MVLENKETVISYRCPDCGSWVSGMAGVFSLSADMFRMKCPCGESEMDIVYGKDKKVRLTVPCFLCPTPHSFTLTSQIFFEKDLFAMSCPYTGMDLCFIGDGDKVKEATEYADEELKGIMDETGYDLFGEKEKEKNDIFSDPQIAEIVNFVIRDLDEAGEITCRCDEDEGCYEVEMTPDGISVKCVNCGAKTLIPVTSTLTAQAFLNCEHLNLE